MFWKFGFCLDNSQPLLTCRYFITMLSHIHPLKLNFITFIVIRTAMSKNCNVIFLQISILLNNYHVYLIIINILSEQYDGSYIFEKVVYLFPIQQNFIFFSHFLIARVILGIVIYVNIFLLFLI